MTHSKASFSSAQIKRLIKLRAVVKVSPSRIRYAEWFKRECVMRADAGESPTYLFREAGLGPEFIGENVLNAAWTDGGRKCSWKIWKWQAARNACFLWIWTRRKTEKSARSMCVTCAI